MPEQFTDTTVSFPHLDDQVTRPLMAKMTRMFRHIGTMREVQRFRQDGCLPLRAGRLSLQAFRLYDQYLSYTTGQLQKKGWKMYCARGCAACCFAMPAGNSIWELLIIYDHLQQSGQLERFFRRNLESCQVLSRVRLQLADRFGQQQGKDARDTDMVLQAYSRARQPCAFLGNSRDCLIYSVRPLACRMHHAFTPPELCDPGHPGFLQAVRLNLSPHANVQNELRTLDSCLSLALSDFLAPGLVTLAANVMRFAAITWVA